MKICTPLLLFFIFITSCAEKGNVTEVFPVSDSDNNHLQFFRSDDSVFFHGFNTQIPVIVFDSLKSLTPCQQKAMVWFEEHQEELFPKIKQQIFSYYQTAYPGYKKLWSSNRKMSEQEIERYLPYPAFPDSILGHMKPVAFIVHSAKNCSENSFSIDFDCTWDPQYGLGIYIENGEVKFASLGQKTYPN
jgi:hypothetical protein